MSEEQDHKRGRPSLPEQAKIRRRLRPFFLNLKSPEFAATETGYEIKTVRRYYKSFEQEILASEEQDFIEQTKITKEQARFVLDGQQSKLENLQRTLEGQMNHSIKQSRGTPQLESWMYKAGVKISNAITDIILKKVSLICSPTADVTLEKESQEFMKRHAITP